MSLKLLNKLLAVPACSIAMDAQITVLDDFDSEGFGSWVLWQMATKTVTKQLWVDMKTTTLKYFISSINHCCSFSEWTETDVSRRDTSLAADQLDQNVASLELFSPSHHCATSPTLSALSYSPLCQDGSPLQDLSQIQSVLMLLCPQMNGTFLGL